MGKRSDYIRDYVKRQLRTDFKWAVHALEVIAKNQTEAEFENEQTTEANCIGFNGRDAKILTSFAKQYEARKYLTDNQKRALHSMIPKYWQQVVNASNKERLEMLVISAELVEMNKIPDDKLALHIMDKWIFDETRVEFLKRIKCEQLVLSI